MHFIEHAIRKFLKKHKFVGVITKDEIVLAFDDKETFVTDGLYLFGLRADIDPYYVIGILNSNLFVFLYRLLALESGRVLGQVKPTILAELPIRTIDMTNTDERKQHDQIVSLVAERLELQKKLAAVRTPAEKTLI